MVQEDNNDKQLVNITYRAVQLNVEKKKKEKLSSIFRPKIKCISILTRDDPDRDQNDETFHLIRLLQYYSVLESPLVAIQFDLADLI